jgi:hypothetical protein
MKRNLGLLGVLIGLLLFTYWFQERRSELAHHEAEHRDQVIREEILQLRLPATAAQKSGGRWLSGEQLLSHNTLRQLERRLGQLKKVKIIEGAPEAFFQAPITFEVNGTAYALGDLSLDQQSFYLSQGEEIMLATIDGETHELTTDERQLAASKYNELRSLLTKSLASLIENQLFRYYPSLPPRVVRIEADGLPGHELNLEKNLTLPAPIPGIAIHDDLKGKFMSLVTQMTIRSPGEFKTVAQGVKVASMDFGDYSWELRLPKRGSADVYLVDPAQQRAWLMIGGTLKAFFGTVQDYWDKKLIPSKQFTHFTRLPVRLTQGDRALDLVVINQEPLGFEATGTGLRDEALSELFQIIFSLGGLDQADRVSQIGATERQQMLSQGALRVEVMGQELLFWPKPSELIVANLTQGFKAHFLGEREKFHGHLKDVIK